MILKCAFLIFVAGSVCLSAQDEPTEREKQLLDVVQKLAARVSALEQKLNSMPSGVATTAVVGAPAPSQEGPPSPPPQAASVAANTPATPSTTPDFLASTTFNLMLDGYYAYNFNRPIGRVNLLRAYDVSSNSFSLNQATVIIERAPDLKAGRRYGVRIDLQYGQATETAQGNPANEPRPQVYRPVWQAYGTYVFPVGSGLTVDFGKWASSLGFEGNYNKDQINYSRSYLFNYLPYYHFGFRSTYNINDRVSVAWWLVNGIGQSEDFNGLKSNAFLFTLKPAENIAWNVNYYLGEEGRDVNAAYNPGLASIPSQPGLSIDVVPHPPRGKTHIFDSTLSWNASSKLLLGAEADEIITRVNPSSTPSRVSAGALYARHQVTPKFALAGRGEYFSDRGGTFSGSTQALKETTGTLEYKLADGFLVRGEWRRDFSNHPFFFADTPGLLKKEQNTATLGMLWWFGGKEGSW